MKTLRTAPSVLNSSSAENVPAHQPKYGYITLYDARRGRIRAYHAVFRIVFHYTQSVLDGKHRESKKQMTSLKKAFFNIKP